MGAIIELIHDLNWNNDEATQILAIEKLVHINDEDLALLVQPLDNKAYWENSAVVLSKIGYPRIRNIIPDLLEWISDLNWPGAKIIFELLLSVENATLIGEIKNALRLAKSQNDYIWIATIKELIRVKGIDDSFLSPEMKEILKLSKFAQ